MAQITFLEGVSYRRVVSWICSSCKDAPDAFFSLKLWDAIFAEDMHPTLQITDFVCLAMLIRIRESLLDADCEH